MPAAWCTTKWKSEPASSSAASAPGGASACMASTARAATPAMTRASACWSALNGSGAVAIEVEGAEADGADLQREAEHRPGPGGDRRAA